MDSQRRSIVTSGLLGLAAAGAAVAATPARRTESAERVSERQAQQAAAARQVENAMSRYTVYESLGRVADGLDEFALDEMDVQADVGFGFYYGAEGIRKFCSVNGLLIGDSTAGTLRNGATHLYANTTPIIGVAEDLKTAKGLWLSASALTYGSPSKGFQPRTGYSRRACDFIYVDGRWKLWHYMVYGLISAPIGKTWTDNDVVEENMRTRFDWIPDRLKPDLPSDVGIGATGGWRPDRPIMQVKVPSPYKTFQETFSYARTS
jgi:hypothetical protein